MRVDPEETRRIKARDLRYKRPALDNMGWEFIEYELSEIRDTCASVRWWSEQDEDTLLAALDGDDEEAFEFKILFSDIEGQADRLYNALYESRHFNDDFQRTFDDCTVALIGDQFKVLGFDTYEDDYYMLFAYDEQLATTECGKRLMRMPKAEMFSTIGQCFSILIAFLNLRHRFDYLKSALDVLHDENMSVIQTVKDIESAYEQANAAGFDSQNNATQKLDHLVSCLPDRAWVE